MSENRLCNHLLGKPGVGAVWPERYGSRRDFFFTAPALLVALALIKLRLLQ